MSFFNVERKKKKGAGDKHTVTHALKKKQVQTGMTSKSFPKLFTLNPFLKTAGWTNIKSHKKKKRCVT